MNKPIKEMDTSFMDSNNSRTNINFNNININR